VYDLSSRITNVIASPQGEAISYQYDDLSRVLQTTAGDKTVAYGYDNAGNRTTLTYPDGTFITYEYDQLSRLTFIKDQDSQVISQYAYDSLSRRTSLEYQNNTRAAYSYNNLNRLTSRINRLTSGPVVSSFAYTYDNVGNRKTMTTLEGTHSYNYDNIYQIKDVDYPSAYPFPDIYYDYDSVGNRTQLSGGTIESYSSNNLNQYTYVNSNPYSYDGNGNLTSVIASPSGEAISYTYDYENRLTHAVIASPQGEAIYNYDPLGRRIKKSIVSSPQSIVNYVYDGDQIIAEYDGSGVLTKKYIYGPGIDEILSTIDYGLSTTYYYHSDGLGSVTDITDSSGALIEKYSYDIYGNAIIKDASGNVLSQSAIGNRYMFTGREYDQETGLYYYRARYYDPSIGRFLQTDPIGYQGGINLYNYVGNSPVNWIDPCGLNPEKKKESIWDKLERWRREGEKNRKKAEEEWRKKSWREKLSEATWNLAPTGVAPYPKK
jgi:RHS repeat-associated protein